MIVDLVMPQIKGTEIINQIHRMRPRTKCMLMTANTYLVNEIHPAKKVITKPWDVYELKEIIRQSVNLNEGENGYKKHYLC